jgi:polysaccharide pyruvyl transferase WcaK-like protein
MHVPPFAELGGRLPALKPITDAFASSDRKAIGIAPNSIVHAKSRRIGIDYVGFLVGAVDAIRAEGYLPVLIPHSYRQQVEKQHNNDRSLCLSVLERLPKGSQCLYVDQDFDSRVLRSLIGELHVLVASRFHSMVSALAMAVPPITFGWGDHKYSEVLDEFGVTEDLYRSYGQMNVGDFSQRLRKVLEQREQLSERIASALGRIQEDARRLPTQLAELAHV